MYIEDEQTTQWPKEKVQKDKQRSTSVVFFCFFYFIAQYENDIISVFLFK